MLHNASNITHNRFPWIIWFLRFCPVSIYNLLHEHKILPEYMKYKGRLPCKLWTKQVYLIYLTLMINEIIYTCYMRCYLLVVIWGNYNSCIYVYIGDPQNHICPTFFINTIHYETYGTSKGTLEKLSLFPSTHYFVPSINIQWYNIGNKNNMLLPQSILFVPKHNILFPKNMVLLPQYIILLV
jgi:hypothetical protein